MKTEAFNNEIVVSAYTSDEEREIISLLSYTDKSKEFQARKMENNRFIPRHLVEKVKQEAHGNLIAYKEDKSIIVPPGFIDQFKIDTDNRVDTGSIISLPWNVEPPKARPYQEEAVEAMEGCHAAGTKVLMYDGTFKNVEDVIAGDLLMGPDSNSKTVLSLIRGTGEMYRINPTKGTSFIVNEDHILSLRRSYIHSKQDLDKEIVNISLKEYLLKNTKFKHKYKLYRSNSINFNQSNSLPIDPYILGLWLGDGTSVAPEFCTIDAEILSAFQEYAGSIGLTVKEKKTSRATDCPSFRIGHGRCVKSGESNKMMRDLKLLDLLNNKHIPHIYKTASIDERRQLLAGLLDTDGCYYEGIFDITQKRKNIAEDIVFLARSLGLAAYMKSSFKKATNSKNPQLKEYWRVAITGDIDMIPTKILRKQATPRKQIKNVLNTGFTVERIGIGEYFGFNLDGDHLYLLDDFTVTHNCWRGTVNLATGMGKSLTSIYFLRKFKRKALIVCPSTAIANGFYEELCKAFGKNRIGFLGSGKKKLGDITVGIAQSVANNLDALEKHELGVIIFDEVHHLAALTFYKIASKLSHVGRMYGLTATAFRSDGKDVFLKAGVGNVIIKRDAAWGIENGWLAFPHFIIRKVNTQGPNYPGDKLKNYKKHVLESKEMTDVICKDINWAVGKQQSVLVLVSEIEHGEILSKATGLPLATGENKESKNLIDALNDGTIPGLIATASLVGEGCDTRRVDVLVLANFAGSAGPVTQNVGRGLRKYPGKEEVIIFDYMPNNQMLARHCNTRIKVFKTLSQEIRIV